MNDFSRFETGIVRFLYSNGNVCGAGFLVLPKYVLTCAHVVRDALGKTEMPLEAPQETLELDFPIVAANQKVKANVVLWQPEEENDIAGLKIAGTIPENVCAIDLNTELKNKDYWKHTCRVYGFTYGKEGRWLENYEINARVLGGKLQLVANKIEDGKIIEKGFSGTPVWDKELNGVVGMISDAITKREKYKAALAVGLEKLIAAVEKLKKREGIDEVINILSPHCQSDCQQGKQVLISINQAYQFCRPVGWTDEPIATSLENKLENLMKMPDGADGYSKILKFVAFLRTETNNVPGQVRGQLRKWAESRTNNFGEICDRVLQERESAPEPSPRGKSYLMVLLEPKDSQSNGYFVKGWLVPDSDRYNAETERGIEQLYLPEEWGDVFTIDGIGKLLAYYLEQTCSFNNIGDLTVELFLPMDLLNHEVERCMVDEDLGFPTPLGCNYKVVVRSYERCRANYRHRKKWEDRWRNLQQVARRPAGDYFILGNCQKTKTLFSQLERQPEKVGVKIADAPKEVGIFSVILKTGIPVALWLRCSLDEIGCSDEIDCVLDCKTIELPEIVLQKRLEAFEQEEDCQNEIEHIGKHLSLLWEDPNRRPPRMMKEN